MNPEDDEALRRAEIDRGHRAERLLEDDLFKTAVEAIKDDIWQKFAKSPVDDDRELLVLRLKLECLDDILRNIRWHVRTGQLAKQQIPLIERAVKTFRR